jgi:hypothetical protein
VDGVALDGEVGGRGGGDLAVEVHRQRRLGDQPDMPAGQVVHPVVFDEASVLEQPCDAHVLPEWPRHDGIDVEEVVIDPGGGGDRVAAAVVPAVSDGHLKQVFELQRLVVPFRELEAGPERLVPGIGQDRGDAVRQGPDVPLQPGAEGFGDSDRQAHGRDVEERLTVDPAEVDVHHLPLRDGGARRGKIVWYLQGAGEVVGGAQRQNTEHNVGAGNPAGGVGHRPVAAADNHQVVPVRKHPVKRPG